MRDGYLPGKTSFGPDFTSGPQDTLTYSELETSSKNKGAQSPPYFYSPSVTPRRIFFEVEFPIYPYRKGNRNNRISLDPMEKPPKPYLNPLLLAMEYREALDSGKYRNQADLAKSLNVSPARISQYLRLLKLPPEIRESVIRMGDLSSPRQITEQKLRTILSQAQGK